VFVFRFRMNSPAPSERQNDVPLRNFYQPAAAAANHDSMIDLVLNVYTKKNKKHNGDHISSKAPIPEWSPSLSPAWKTVKNQWVAMKKWIHANPKQADRHLLELVLLIELMAEEKVNPTAAAAKQQTIKKKTSYFCSWIGFFIIITISSLVVTILYMMNSMHMSFL